MVVTLDAYDCDIMKMSTETERGERIGWWWNNTVLLRTHALYTFYLTFIFVDNRTEKCAGLVLKCWDWTIMGRTHRDSDTRSIKAPVYLSRKLAMGGNCWVVA